MSSEQNYKDPSLSIRPANPNKDRFQYFLHNSKYILNKLYQKEYQPNVSKRSYTEKLTKYPHEGNQEYIKSLVNLNGGVRNLVIAPTGSGKTYTIDAIFQEIKAESTERQLLCLLCPNKIQNIQNENSDDYDFEALIQGVYLEETEEDIRQISAVYDKLPEISKYKKDHPECRLRVVIDECQNLISANKFREKAIHAIMKLIDDNLADSYTFITATYDSMCCIAFDNITLFEDRNYKPVFQAIDIRYTERSLFDNAVVDTALHEGKAYVRLNDKKKIQKLKDDLSKKGKKCYSVTADDKGYKVNDDGTVTYNNIIFDHITNADDLYNNEGEADTIFATSMLDVGTNFTKYSPQSTPVFAVTMPKMMNVDEIEQAFNRFRPQKDALGNTVRLKHAVILQQKPRFEITKIRVMKYHNSHREYEYVKSIPPKSAHYKDNTTPEEKEQGFYNATLTLPGKYFAELDTGYYIIECVIGDHGGLMVNGLFVNLYDKPQDQYSYLKSLDKDTKYKIFENWMEAVNACRENISLNIRMANLMSACALVATEFDFIYNTGDENVSAKCNLKPFSVISTLAEFFDTYYQKARKQLAKFHDYQITENNSMTEDTDFSFPDSSEKEISITLPSLSINQKCSYISINNAENEKIVSISCPINGKIHFTDSQGQKLITISCSSGKLSLSILNTKYPKCGALTEGQDKTLKIISAPSRDDVSGNDNWHYNKNDIPPSSPVTIIDTIHHCRIILTSNMSTQIDGKPQREHLEDLLNVFRTLEPDVGDALYFTSSMRLMIDYHKLFNSAYTAYQNQFFYYPDHLSAELQSRLHIPVSITEYAPINYRVESVPENRNMLLENLNMLYQNPATRSILYDVLHSDQSIPNNGLDDVQRKMISELLQSNLYKREYKSLKKLSSTITFDYIIKVLNFAKKEKDTNKHIKRLEYMIINQAIQRNDTQLPFRNGSMYMQFKEQQTLITIINDRKQSTGTKKFTVTDKFIEDLTQEFNSKMTDSFPKYNAMSSVTFKHLLEFTYIIINKNSATRKPELTEPIMDLKDVPFEN